MRLASTRSPSKSPKSRTFSEAEHQHRADAEIAARSQLSAHFSEQVRAGRYRDIPERVLFEHSARRDTEPDAQRMNQ